MVFGTFSAEIEPLEDFLGPVMRKYIDRVFHRPIRVLGYSRQYMAGNWKLYSENSRDSYHGALLHLFYPTFGIYRQSQDSAGELAEQGFHNVFTVSKPKGDIDYGSFGDEANREMQGAAKLQDESLLQFRPEIEDDVGLHIQSLFPSVVLQQIQNTLATRQIVTHGVDKTELVWTYFGYADDDEETTRHRLRNLNLVGPSGLISMEDGEAVELASRARSGPKASTVSSKWGRRRARLLRADGHGRKRSARILERLSEPDGRCTCRQCGGIGMSMVDPVLQGLVDS
ncbi:SRPBCC family protein [Novosphingobium panipatense]